MFRIILDYYRDPLVNMAVDEAIYRYRDRVDFDTLRIYMWRPSGVSIGRSQDIHKTLNLDCIWRLGYLPVVRPTGGGALLHMEGGEVTYSVVIGSEHPLFSLDILSSSIEIARGIYYALDKLGVKPYIPGEFKSNDEPLCYFRRGSSDILVDGRKISGSAQVRSSKSLLQHGTLLLKIDVDKWECVIRNVDRETFLRKVTSLKTLGINVGLKKLYESLVEGFLKVFNTEYFLGSLLPEELELVDKLLKEKYFPWFESLNYSK